MPLVSVIVPCYNEQATIHLLLQSLYAQTYPRAEMEVVIADGLSSDRTRERIRNFQEAHTDLQIRVIENAKRTIPSGLNRAIETSRGEFVVRLDAHSVPRPDYVARCVAALDQGLGDIVGGIWEIQAGGEGWIARAIAAAAAHPLGVGDARYRYTTTGQLSDTVPFGAFRRETVARIGCFDETLLTNEDYEFNTRLRQSGGKVWLDPAIRSVYFARPTLRALARQYSRYGYWKARMLRRYPASIRWRQGLPPVFVLSLLVLGFSSIWFYPIRWLLVLELTSYFLVLLAVGFQLAIKKHDMRMVIGVPLAVAIMHLAWGGALLLSSLQMLMSKDGYSSTRSKI